MKSMTGYGRGEARTPQWQIICEVSAVNSKGREVAVRLPRELEELEARIKEAIGGKTARGKFSVSVSFHVLDSQASARPVINRPVAQAHLTALRQLKKDMKLSGEVSLELLARQPGVFQTASESYDADKVWPLVSKALGVALMALIKMRQKEGAHLRKDIADRLKNLRSLRGAIAARAPEVVNQHRRNLHERIKNAGVDLPQDDDRLIKEIVFFADRSDISEELTRLDSHFKQLSGALEEGEPVGRQLDFLIQEMNREVNTIGSKANDIEISKRVVEMKAELEKIREQIQNIE
ncbi:MAG: YicC/YloC family endoribonuclease [Verrucomicrobiae bacterium]|nr:YicC/YloC family endoribonuclease [Verrucomicrobiae bacterium]